MVCLSSENTQHLSWSPKAWITSFFKGFRKHESEILLDDSSFAPTRLTTDNTALCIQGGEARFCFPRKGARDMKYANQAAE